MAGGLARSGHHVQGGHGQPGAVGERADVAAVELHEVDAALAGQSLLRVARLGVAHAGDVGMPVERVVVDGVLRVERAHHPIRRDDQRVDLDQHRVGLDEGAVGAFDDRTHLLHLGGGDAGGETEPANVERLQPHQRVDVQARQLLGRLLSHRLDLDSALRCQHQQRLLGAAVEGDREVVLAGDVGGALDPELPHRVAADVHPQDRRGVLLGVGRVGRQLYAAGLAAPTHQHLGLYHHRSAELLGHCPRLGGGGRRGTLGDGQPEPREQLLTLVLE